jgi:hypothetical protein
MDGKADIYSRSLEGFSGVANQHSTRSAKAQETKRRFRVAYFVTWNALSPHRDSRRLHARPDQANPLGFGAPDALASSEEIVIQTNQERPQKAAAGSEHGHEIADLRHVGN